MVDRRALILGSWLAKGRDKPSAQRIRSITDRWGKIFDNYKFRSLRNHKALPKPIHNPKISDVIDQLTRATNVTNDTELLIHFVGHSTSVGEDDIAMILGLEQNGEERRCNLSWLIDTIYKQSPFKKLIVILDTCHAGRTTKSFHFIRHQTFAMFGTGDSYAFDAIFSDGVLSALERPLKKSDQRIDKRAGGITYQRIFEDARRKVIIGSSQTPQCYGDYGGTVILKPPPSVTIEFNPYAQSRSVYVVFSELSK